MIQTSTHNEVIKYLYEETTEEENKLIESDLIFNGEVTNVFNDLSSVKKYLDKGFRIPNKRVIDNILNYSKSLNCAI